MSDLVQWLNACYDRAEQKARDAMGDPDDIDPWTDPYGEFQSRGGPIFDHVLVYSPKWRLADLRRKREILAAYASALKVHEGEGGTWDTDSLMASVTTSTLADVVRLLAEEFADEPGYDERWREEWRP